MTSDALRFTVEDPASPDSRALLEQHLAHAREVTPPGEVHALDIDGLREPTVTFVAVRRDGELVAVGALKELDATHAEIKSMHVAAGARRQGLGRSLVEHLLATARRRGYERVSLETGANDAFAPARDLYASIGFVVVPAFGAYREVPHGVCMSKELTPPPENR